MKNLAEFLGLKTYSENGKHFDVQPGLTCYEIILKDGKMAAAEIKITDEICYILNESIGRYGSIYNAVNLFICIEDAEAVIDYIQRTVGIPDRLPHWLGDPSIPDNLVEIFGKFDCYGHWDWENIN